MIVFGWVLLGLWIATVITFLSFFVIGSSASFQKLRDTKDPDDMIALLRCTENRSKLEKSQKLDSFFLPLYTTSNLLLPTFALIAHKLPIILLIVSVAIIPSSFYGAWLDSQENCSILRILRASETASEEVKAAARTVNRVQVGKVAAFAVNFSVGTALALATQFLKGN